MNSETPSRVVLVTGASSGIGKAIAEFLQKKGFAVFGTSRNPEKFVDKVSFPLISLDVRNISSITFAVREVLDRAEKIDILINNAGVGITGPIEEIPDDEINKAFEINYFGPLKVIKAVLPHMRKKRSGFIINITSIAGYMGLPYRGIYSASKAALELTTEAFRMELRDFNIQMSNVAPGDFATNIASGRYHAPVREDSPYKDTYGKTLKLMDKHVGEGQDPEIIAKAVYRIIKLSKPRAHYKIGQPLQKFSILLKRILPDKMYERILMKHYKL